MRRILALDLDDTVNVLCQIVHEGLKRRGYDVPPAQWNDYELYRAAGMDIADFQAMVIEDRMLELAEPDPAALEAIRHVQQQGVKVEIWTARAWHPSALAITSGWFEQRAVEDVGVRLVPFGHSKAELVDEVEAEGGIVIGYADDHARHATEVATRLGNERVVLLSRAWNAHATYATRAPHVGAAIDHILKINGLRPRIAPAAAPVRIQAAVERGMYA